MSCGCAERWAGPPLDRRQALTLLAALAAGCSPVTAAHRDAAQRLAEEAPSVDLHGYHGLPGYVDHIERMIKAVGVDHVGIGTDMDGISPPSFVAMDDYGDWPSVTGALLARGYSREDVARVAGGNFLRVLQQVTE